MLNRKKFLVLLSAVCELYGRELSKVAIELYYNVLKEYGDVEVERAFNEAVKTHQYNCLPVPAKIVEIIKDRQDLAKEIKGLIGETNEDRLTSSD